MNRKIYSLGLKNDEKYKTPNSKRVKKALTTLQLKTLFNSEVKNENEAKAKTFQFFSYACSGMNLKDITLLNNSGIKSNQFEYYRAKKLIGLPENNHNNLVD
jgi:hypothetical protein